MKKERGIYVVHGIQVAYMVSSTPYLLVELPVLCGGGENEWVDKVLLVPHFNSSHFLGSFSVEWACSIVLASEVEVEGLPPSLIVCCSDSLLPGFWPLLALIAAALPTTRENKDLH